MKKKAILTAISLLVIIASLFSACTENKQSPEQTTRTSEKSYDLIIKELEEKILELQQNHYVSEAERQKQIEELLKEIDALRSETASGEETTTSATLPKSVFTYEIKDDKLWITGFTGDDEHIVIPSEIDEKKVYGISDSAFEGYSFKSVIISDGVEYIDWFAFYNCSSLCSITIPSSVYKIGYSAFDGASKAFTVYCHSGSFAQSYAESYGITYALI
ncbi:MAG: leucine-rich repeat protein [Clostridia bacterium]|nr:leucine-rich repeat protein [Clostridia bacterium]